MASVPRVAMSEATKSMFVGCGVFVKMSAIQSLVF